MFICRVCFGVHILLGWVRHSGIPPSSKKLDCQLGKIVLVATFLAGIRISHFAASAGKCGVPQSRSLEAADTIEESFFFLAMRFLRESFPCGEEATCPIWGALPPFVAVILGWCGLCASSTGYRPLKAQMRRSYPLRLHEWEPRLARDLAVFQVG